ncbi:MAG: hypothetical protein Q8L22_27170 [Reyranella sp.]|nr:hypothetical protein [Reyranella sp.]
MDRAMSEKETFYEFNILESRAAELLKEGRARDVLRIYTLMADGDPSLDAGYLAERFGQCYELLGEPYMAKYWYGKAIEEAGGPLGRSHSAARRERLEKTVTLDDLVARELYVFSDQHACWEASRKRNIEFARAFDAANKAKDRP